MKNLLVVLVTAGMGYAYWYQLPDAPAVAPAPPPVAAVVPAPRPAFIAAHTALDEPAVPANGRSKQTSVLLGSDNVQHTR